MMLQTQSTTIRFLGSINESNRSIIDTLIRRPSVAILRIFMEATGAPVPCVACTGTLLIQSSMLVGSHYKLPSISTNRGKCRFPQKLVFMPLTQLGLIKTSLETQLEGQGTGRETENGIDDKRPDCQPLCRIETEPDWTPALSWGHRMSLSILWHGRVWLLAFLSVFVCILSFLSVSFCRFHGSYL